MKKKNRIWIYSLIAMGFLLILTISCKKEDKGSGRTITDIDGNIYDTVHIGTQV